MEASLLRRARGYAPPPYAFHDNTAVLTPRRRLLATLAILVTGCARIGRRAHGARSPRRRPTPPRASADLTCSDGGTHDHSDHPADDAPDDGCPVTPERLAGAMVLCSFAEPAVPAWVLERVQAGLAAGVLLYRRNLPSEMQAVGNAAAVQAAAQASPSPMCGHRRHRPGRRHRRPDPGAAQRLGGRHGLLPPPAIEAEGRATADLLRRWGVNTDLAPVADVARPDTFEARSRRSFGGDPAVVSGAVSAFVSGLRAGVVAATLKHFPGLGAASANTDHAEGAVTLSVDELRGIDLAPFRSGVAAGAELVMVSSATYPALAPMSP